MRGARGPAVATRHAAAARRSTRFRTAVVAVAVGLGVAASLRCSRRTAFVLHGSELGRRGGQATLSEEPSELFESETVVADTSEVEGTAQELPPKAHVCAVEGQTCQCQGTASFHSWTGDWRMVRYATGAIQCTADAFGSDPRPHFAKLCSCQQGMPWDREVFAGLNSTIAAKLVPRVEIAASGSSCSPEDDHAWTPCAVMSTRVDASLIPDRFIHHLSPLEQMDVALRKMDDCARIAGPKAAMRVLGVMPGKSPNDNVVPITSVSAPVCAMVYSPEGGVAWDARSAVFCPTDPARCLTQPCECANPEHERRDMQEEGKEGKPCYACVPPEKEPEGQKSADSEKDAEKQAPAPAAPAAATGQAR